MCASGLPQDRRQRTQRLRHRQVDPKPADHGGERGRGAEWHLTRHRLDQGDSQRIDIRSPVDRAACRLLRRGVAGRPDQGLLGLGPRRLGDRSRDTEVSDPQSAHLVEEQVGRLDVAVHEPPIVSVSQALGRLESDQQGLGNAEHRAPIEHGAKTPSRQQLADEKGRRDLAIGLGLGVGPVEHGDDVRMAQLGGSMRLGPETPAETIVGAEGGVEDLHRDSPPQRQVFGQVHHGRRASTKGREKSIAGAEHPPGVLLESDGHATMLSVRRYRAAPCTTVYTEDQRRAY